MPDSVRNRELEDRTEAGRAGGAEWFSTRVGMGLLLFVLILVVWIFCLAGAISLDRSLHRSDFPGMLPGVELAVVPIAAFVAARWRIAAGRLGSLHSSGIGPYLSLLMSATLVGLVAYLVWSWTTPLTTAGPSSEIGLVRWLGAALAAAFTCIWLPIFPRVTLTLAGMIAGAVLFAGLGYALFPSQMTVPDDRWGTDGGHGAAFFAVLVILIWIAGAVWLAHHDRQKETSGLGPRPMNHAIWIGLLMFCSAALAL